MTKVIMKMEELVNLADTVSASLLDGIRITIRPTKEGKNYISFCACDRTCQSEALAECKTDVTKVEKFIVDKAFVSSVRALEQTGADKVTLRFANNGVTLKAGEAQVEAALRTDMTDFTDCDPSNAVAKIVVDTKEFITAVKKGGYAYSVKGCRMAAFNDAVAFVPWAEGEDCLIKVLSINGSSTIVTARNLTLEQGEESIRVCFDENKAWFVNATYLFKILSRLQSEKTQLIVWEKQLLIHNGNTSFCCILGSEEGFKRNILESMFVQKHEPVFAMALDVKKLRSAMEVASVGIRSIHNEGDVMEFILENRKVTFTSYGGGAKMTVECDQAMGEAHLAVSLELMKKIVSQVTGNQIMLSGATGPIMVSDCDKESRTLLAPHQTREQQEEQARMEEERGQSSEQEETEEGA